MDEPELHFGGVLVPDLARVAPRAAADVARARLPDARAGLVCEMLSPSTETLDRGAKLRVYAREGVAHAWLVDSLRHTLEVLALERGRWASFGTREGAVAVAVPPFEPFELDLGSLWI